MNEQTERIYRAAAAEDWQETSEIAELCREDLLAVATTLQAGILSEEVQRTDDQGVIRWRITSRGRDLLPKRRAAKK